MIYKNSLPPDQVAIESRAILARLPEDQRRGR
jgi:hypothetical protein